MQAEFINGIWEVTLEPLDINDFCAWVTGLDTYNLALKINGELYRFSSLQELACFSYGLSLMNRMVMDPSVKEFQLQQQKRAKELDEKAHEKRRAIVETVKELQEFVTQKEKELAALTSDIVVITYK